MHGTKAPLIFALYGNGTCLIITKVVMFNIGKHKTMTLSCCLTKVDDVGMKWWLFT
jgi:hypothetical protein